MKLFKKIVYCFLFFLSPLSTAETLKIGAGSLSGEYANTIVPSIDKALKSQGYRAIPVISAGSPENLEKIKAGQLVAALMQFDVAVFNMTAQQDLQQRLLLLGKIAPEALFCAAKKGGKIATYDDLTDERTVPLKVAIGNKKGGTAATFHYLMQLDTALASQHFEFFYKEDIHAEINRLLSGGRDLVCFVMMPNPDNALVQAVVTNEALFFINIDKPIFKRAPVGYEKVYDIQEILISEGLIFEGKIKTLVTWVGLVVNREKIDKKLLNIIKNIVEREDLLPTHSLAAKAKILLEKVAKMTQ